ncbi:lysM and putative peptidoglycan-binding domain-containing protein 2 [Tachyglossus aculeatus]|uniref:lysM and putative peptidoglycan-binding domain-containing protein 2 n=1 Tax=Tachyglossus aculeatus TaxID=9261 RepID=UPI0018F481D4|nr:lysM and putative peptidoglycan-binding domain-containing protein 2 [Tachyglossus aculeatus]
MRAAGGAPWGPEPGQGELSPVLAAARPRPRSYGSTAPADPARPPGPRPGPPRSLQHRVATGDTLQGIALKFGVTMEQIKRANKLFTNDCIFLKETLNIPMPLEKPSPFNGLDSLDSPDGEPPADPCPSAEDAAPGGGRFSPSPQIQENAAGQAEELSAKDFLRKLDLQIKLSTQAARKLKEESRDADAADSPYAGSSYHM